MEVEFNDNGYEGRIGTQGSLEKNDEKSQDFMPVAAISAEKQMNSEEFKTRGFSDAEIKANRPNEEQEIDERKKKIPTVIQQPQETNKGQNLPIKAERNMDIMKQGQAAPEQSKSSNQKSLLEILEYTYEHWKNRPSSLEKHLYTLQYLGKVLELDKTRDANMIKEEFKINLDQAFERLAIEKEGDQEMQKHLTSIKTFFETDSKAEFNKKISEIAQKIRHLNISEIKRLISKVQHASKVISGKDILLLLGGTGTGKSTTMHYLAGSVLESTKENGIPHIKPVSNEKYPDIIKEVRCSPFAVSETRYITAVQINTENSVGDEIEIFLCDTPGFEDTSGPEVDIANSIGIVTAIAETKSVRPVIFISQKEEGGRMARFGDLIQMLLEMMPKMNVLREAFSFVFTHYQQKHRSSISPKMKDLFEQLKKNETQSALETIIKQIAFITRNPDDVMMIDPLNKEGPQLLQKLLKTTAIERPQENFKTFLSERSLKALKDQIHMDQEYISKALLRNEFTLIKDKIDDLIIIKDIFGENRQHHIAEELASIGKKVLFYIKKDLFQVPLDKFVECLKKGNLISESHIRNLKVSSQILKDTEELVRLLEKNLKLENCLDCSALETDLKPKIDENLIQPTLTCDDFINQTQLLEENLGKLFMIKSIFKTYEEEYNKLIDFLKELIITLEAKKADNYSLLYKINVLKRKLQKYFPPLSEFEEEKRKEIKNSIEKNYNDTKRLLSEFITSEVAEKISKNLENLEENRKLNYNASFILEVNEYFEKLKEEILNNIKEKVVKNTKIIREILDKLETSDKETGEFAKIEKPFSEIFYFYNSNEQIKSKIILEYYDLQDDIKTYHGRIERKIENIISNLDNDINKEESVNFKTLSNSISILESSKWLINYKVTSDKKNSYEETIASIEKILKDYLTGLSKSIDYLNIGYDSNKTKANLKELNKIWNKQQEIALIENKFQSLAQDRKKINDSIETILDKEVKKIEADYSSKNIINVYKMCFTNFLSRSDKVCRFIDLLDTFMFTEKKAVTLRRVFADFFNILVEGLNDKIDKNFSLIKKFSGSQDSFFKVVDEVSHCLQNLKDFDKYKDQLQILEVGDQKYWEKELKKFSTVLDDELNQSFFSSKIADFNSNLMQCKILSSLIDGILEIKPPLFDGIYKKYISMTTNDNIISSKELYSQVDAFKFTELIKNLDELQKAAKLGDTISETKRERAIGYLISNMDNLKEEIEKNIRTMKMKSMEPETYQEIKRKADIFIPKNLIILEGTINTDKYKEFYTKTKSVKLKDLFLNYLDDIDRNLEATNFDYVEKQLHNFDVLIDVENPESEGGDIEKRHKAILKSVEKLGDELKEKYKRPRDFKTSPPIELIKNLKNTKIFNNICKKIESHIEGKLNEKIQRIIEKKPSIGDKKASLNKLIRCLKYLPNNIEQRFKEKINDKITTFETSIKTFQDNIKRSIDLNTNGCEILKFIEDINKGKGGANEMNLVKNHIIQQSRNHKNECIKCIEGREEWITLVRYYTEFYMIFKGKIENEYIEPDFNQIKHKFADTINICFERLDLYFQAENLENIIASKSKGSIIKEEGKLLKLIFDDLVNIKPEVLKSFEEGFVDKIFTSLKKFSKNVQELLKKHSKLYPSDIYINLDDLIDLLYNTKSWELFIKRNSYLENLKKKIHPLQTVKTEGKNKDKSERTIWDLDDQIHKEYKDIIESLEKCPSYDKVCVESEVKISEIFTSVTKWDPSIKYDNNVLRKKRISQQSLLLKTVTKIERCQPLLHLIPKKLWDSISNYCSNSINETKQKISNLSKELDNLISMETYNNNQLESLNDMHANLVMIFQEFEDLKVIDPNTIKELDKKLLSKINKLEEAAEKNMGVLDHFAQNIMFIKKIDSKINWKNDDLKMAMNNLLKKYKIAKGANQINKLGFILASHPEGKIIIEEHGEFKGYNICLYNQKTQTQDIEYVIKKIEGTNINKKILKTRYDEYFKVYDENIKRYLKPKNEFNIDPLKENIIALASRATVGVAFDRTSIQWTIKQTNILPKLIALVFSYWTLSNADNYFEAEGERDQSDYLLMPHPAQVITVFRSLGVGDEDEYLSNNLVQVLTGEGKSVILGITSTVLALLGFDISCACYSEYLSSRDYDSFLPIFEKFNIDQYIKYGTFNSLCERIINQNGDVRKIVENMIISNSYVKNKDSFSHRPKILLIDEVDVFFSPEFYGEKYCPAASLRHPTIKELIDIIWDFRNHMGKLSLNHIKTTPQYMNCQKIMGKFNYMLDEAVKDMIADLKTYEKHKYECINGKIGYKEIDEINFTAVYGYQTLFAYFLEHSRKKISTETLAKNTCIRLNVGEFSYAEIPLTFQYILGVTGTLRTLSEPEKDVVHNKYGILKETFNPSVFGTNNIRFNKNNEDVFIEDKEYYYRRIANEITKASNRAVLVFFESEEELLKFQKENTLEFDIKSKLKTITEKDDAQEKSIKIKSSSTMGQVTLLTKAFGRGTDFISRDDNVNRNGGVHVIQTFLSNQESEEVQIRGRTARQGQEGSYCLVVKKEVLEKYGINEEELELNRGAQAYNLLNSKRNAAFKDIYESKKGFIAKTENDHKETIAFFEAIKSKDDEKIKKYLLIKNTGQADVSNIRILVLMDATGSMGSLLEKCKNNVSDMFEGARKTLAMKGIDSGCFQLQLAVYRDYDCSYNGILESSPWETKPESLRTFMTKIVPKGGGDYEEAIEIGLQHAFAQHCHIPLSQIILIADAPAKTPEQIKSYRSTYGGDLEWTEKFGPATHYITELNKFNASSNPIPVNTFHIGARCKPNLLDIATRTKGVCQDLPINDVNGGNILTDFVTTEILRSIGQKMGNADELVSLYKKNHAKYVKD